MRSLSSLDHAPNIMEIENTNFTDAATGTYLYDANTEEETEGGEEMEYM